MIKEYGLAITDRLRKIMERAKWDYDFRGTKLKGYFKHYDFEKIFLHRIGTWYAVKMGEHYDLLRARDDRGWGEIFFGL